MAMHGNLPAAQVGMAGPFTISQVGQPHTVDHVFLICATQGNVPQVVYNDPFIQMSWPLLEGFRNAVPLAGIICFSEFGKQVMRMADLWVRSDPQGRNIHPYVEIGVALAILPPFYIAPTDADGVQVVTLRTGENIGKFEVCGHESHVVLKLGGGVAAIAPGQEQSYVPGGVFRTLFKRTAKQWFYMCDCHGRDGHGAWALPGGLQAGAGAVIAHAATLLGHRTTRAAFVLRLAGVDGTTVLRRWMRRSVPANSG
jgi:hypothetical protein